MVGSTAALVFFGRLSDQLGRRPVLFVALALAAAGMVAFPLASDTAMLFVARTLNGLANGLTASPPAPPGSPISRHGKGGPGRGPRR